MDHAKSDSLALLRRLVFGETLAPLLGTAGGLHDIGFSVHRGRMKLGLLHDFCAQFNGFHRIGVVYPIARRINPIKMSQLPIFFPLSRTWESLNRFSRIKAFSRK